MAINIVGSLLGPWLALRLCCYGLMALLGALLALVAVGAEEWRRLLHRPLWWRPRGAKPMVRAMRAREHAQRPDPRITGAVVVDTALNEVWKLRSVETTTDHPKNNTPQLLDLVVRDYILNWYQSMSQDEEFLLEIRRLLCHTLGALAHR